MSRQYLIFPELLFYYIFYVSNFIFQFHDRTFGARYLSPNKFKKIGRYFFVGQWWATIHTVFLQKMMLVDSSRYVYILLRYEMY